MGVALNHGGSVELEADDRRARQELRINQVYLILSTTKGDARDADAGDVLHRESCNQVNVFSLLLNGRRALVMKDGGCAVLGARQPRQVVSALARVGDILLAYIERPT